MTSADMYYECEVGFDAITNFSGPGIVRKEWSAFLTESQEELIKARLNPKGNKYQESFEETEKRSIDFSELIRYNTGTLSATQTDIFNRNGLRGYMYDLPTDFFYAISESVLLDTADCSTTATDYLTVSVKPVTHDYINANYKNPHKKPYVDRDEGLVWRLKHGRSDIDFTLSATGGYTYDTSAVHQLITDGDFAVTEYHVRYLRYPLPIIIADINDTTNFRGYAMNVARNCELDPSFHPEIVAEAVKKAAAAVKDREKYEIENIESLKSE